MANSTPQPRTPASVLVRSLTATTATTLRDAGTTATGLDAAEAVRRLQQYGPNILHERKLTPWPILIRQLTGNPLVLILVVATTVSYLLGQHVSAYYIFGMIILSMGLGFWNEYAAERTVQNLLKKVSLAAVVIRGGEKLEIPVAHVTIGDIVLLGPGSVIPADLRLIEVDNLEVNESTLTGESKPVYKTADPLKETPDTLSDYTNVAFMSTTVTSGAGRGVVLAINHDTEFGKIAHAASFVKPETEFQKGLGAFGNLIVRVILILSAAIFGVNALLGHSLIDSLLFALAIAVGLTPELLPIIVTISLSHGAGKLAKKHVITKQLISLENLGNMDILCTDKTGTLTEGHIRVADTYDPQGKPNTQLYQLGLACNTALHHHKVVGNAIDVALWNHAHEARITLPADFQRLQQEPFDFDRQAMLSVVKYDHRHMLILKGSPEAVLARCTPGPHITAARERFATLSSQGQRTVAIATLSLGSPHASVKAPKTYTWDDARDLEFQGFITLVDIPKPSAKASLQRLYDLGVDVKIITGDSELITRHICDEINVPITRIITGAELDGLTPDQLAALTLEANVFARVTPSQKLAIIQTLQSQGHTVGFLGDGINDIPSLHNADVGISVNTAVDVAKDAAPVVLLRSGLDTIADGIIEGRRTFNNTIKYILMATSSNFGNMFSAAGASFFLPFLPMTPLQILLNNSLYDISQIAIPSDNVDAESLRKPRHWNIKFLKYYMLFFGPISSLYDLLTFAILIALFQTTNPALFQTGWFMESLATQVLVIFIIRTSKTPFYKSRPSRWLVLTCLTVVGIGLILPISPIATALGFTPLPPLYYLILLVLVTTYLILVGLLKSLFLRRFSL